MTSPHNYTDKELKGEKHQVHSHFILSPCSWSMEKGHSGDDSGGFKNSRLKNFFFVLLLTNSIHRIISNCLFIALLILN